jgi:hypothetical protein
MVKAIFHCTEPVHESGCLLKTEDESKVLVSSPASFNLMMK